MRKHLLLQLILWLAIAQPKQACSQEAVRPVGQLHHTSWNEASGLSGAVYSLTQTSDGFLWIGTSTGLYRFDGVRFDAIREFPNGQPVSEVRALLPTQDGGLWVGYRTGAAFLKNGAVQVFTEQQGLPYGRVRGLAQTRNGDIWAAVVGGFAHFANGRWEKVRDAWGYPDHTANSVAVDTQGTLWVTGETSVRLLPAGERTFHESGFALGSNTLLRADADGSMWAADVFKQQVHRWRFANGQLADELMLDMHAPLRDLLLDRSGSLWLALGDGVRRVNVAAPEAADAEKLLQVPPFTEGQGLSGPSVAAIFEDREGNLWVGTSNGLDRFRKKNAVQTDIGYSPSHLVTGPHGEVWAAPYDKSFLTPIHNAAPFPVLNHLMFSLYMDRTGTLWAGMQGDESPKSRALWRMAEGKASIVPPPPDVPAPYIKGIVSDITGKLWMTISGAGEYTLKDGVWERIPVLRGKDADLAPDAECVDAAGRAWLVYYARSTVALVDHGKLQLFTPGHGFELGQPLVTWASGSQVWVSGTKGMGLFAGDHFAPLQGSDGSAFANVTAILPTLHNGLWLKSPDGIVHIPADDIARFIADPSTRVHSRIFDGATDFTAQLVRYVPSPSGTEAAQSGDGKLWFITRNGVAMIDPAHLVTNALPPPVVIRSITANGKVFSASSDLRLPKATQDLAFDYTALSLTFPERNRFRYVLVGFDKDWQDAGTRRQAFYTNLPPGRYSFKVIASNNDGVWNTDGASIVFTLPPTFIQTLWFRILCAALVVGVVALFFLWRLRQIEQRTRNQLAERLAERNRIARDLHDTLLQGFQGVLLRFQAAALTMRPEDPAFDMLQGALNRADHVLAEGRDRVRDLREPEIAALSVAEQYRRVAEELEIGNERFHLLVEGEARKLNRVVHDETYWIVREALTNASLHSQAHSIRVHVHFAKASFVVRIEDDGIGIHSATLRSGREGHFGLRGMRERAERMGAAIAIHTREPQGTVVEVALSSRIAYAPESRTP